MIFGYILVIVGDLFFLRTIGWLPGLSWDYIWPLLLVCWGLAIILGKGRRRGCWCCCAPYRKEGKEEE